MKLANTIQFINAEMGRPLIHHVEHWNTICMDFDGVLSESDGPYVKDHFGDPVPEGLKLLGLLLARKFKVVILTARKETDLVAVWLADHGFPNMFVTNNKVPAIAYIDDRGITFDKEATAVKILNNIKKMPGGH